MSTTDSYFFMIDQFQGFARSIAILVHDHFTLNGHLSDINLEFVANTLCISKRSLQRRLKEEGMSWFVIFDKLRRYYLLDLLSSNTSISDIIVSLGYQDRASLSVASKRWFGMPIGQARKQLSLSKEEETSAQPSSEIKQLWLDYDYRMLEQNAQQLESQLSQVRAHMLNIEQQLQEAPCGHS